MLTRRTFVLSTMAFLAGCGGTRTRTTSARPTRGEPLYVPEARAYVVDVPPESLDAMLDVYPDALHDGMRAGVLALSQKCTHLGCRVPFCTTSDWFECGCHVSLYSRTGELRGGPAPRGLDFYVIGVNGAGEVEIDTARRVTGLPAGTEVVGKDPTGPHCVGTLD